MNMNTSQIAFSVIVTTSPGREQNLAACLALLKRQLYPPLEVLVIDDGSSHAKEICRKFEADLNLSYFWRENDCCVSKSRNLGAKMAQEEHLVFLDSDMLLNPHGLAAYAEYLHEFPEHVLYGYFGYVHEYIAPSYFIGSREVMWCDRRFEEYNPQGLIPAQNMIRFPHEWAWSGNLAIKKTVYDSIAGFDQEYRGWGGEDLDFAWRLIQKNWQIHFFLDAWAEHQVHNREEKFHQLSQVQRNKEYEHQYEKVNYKVQILHSSEGWKRLKNTIFSHYLKTGRGLSERHQSQTKTSPLPQSESGKNGLKSSKSPADPNAL